PIRDDGDSGEWQDWLVDESSSQEARLVASEESDNRRKALGEALDVLNERERRIFEARRLGDEAVTLEELAPEFRGSRGRGAPDGGAGLRKGSEGGKEPSGRDGSAAGAAGPARPLKSSRRSMLICGGAGLGLRRQSCPLHISAIGLFASSTSGTFREEFQWLR